jgi:TPR repeat protein
VQTATERSAPQPVEDQRVEQASSEAAATEPAPAGRAFVQGLLAQKPAAQALYNAAETREAAADCEAAVLLYERAANADPGVAGRVARRYDPGDFRPSPCIPSPDLQSALVWYEDAARAGHTWAQRRLGRLLTGQKRSGILYEEGRDWLARAAAGGDEEARRILDGLDSR